MKINVYSQFSGENHDGDIWFAEIGSPSDNSMESRKYLYKFLGTLDLPIEPPKRLIHQEINASTYDEGLILKRIGSLVPAKAKNIRILYDIEENQ